MGDLRRDKGYVARSLSSLILSYLAARDPAARPATSRVRVAQHVPHGHPATPARSRLLAMKESRKS